MNETEEKMEKLQELVKAGPEYLEKNFELGMQYVTDSVVPALKDVLKDLCLEIEEHHKLDKPEEGKENFVIHYTSIATLVSMLQNALKNKKDVSEDERESSKDEQSASLRLYDSIHFNDPDEGEFFDRNLPKKYDWLIKKEESHAYIASFIILDKKRNMSDDLVFWRTYGKEGEGCSLKLRIPSCQLRKILYGADKIKRTGRLLRPVLDTLNPLINIRKRSIKEDVQEKLAEAIWEFLARIRYLYKDKAYEYEQECRFVIPELNADKDKICFEYNQQNNASTRIRHYYEDDALKIENILTTDSLITLGPCVPYRYNMRYYLKSLLEKNKLAGPEIKLSEISYRKS